jgi:hypothetical protein
VRGSITRSICKAAAIERSGGVAPTATEFLPGVYISCRSYGAHEMFISRGNAPRYFLRACIMRVYYARQGLSHNKVDDDRCYFCKNVSARQMYISSYPNASCDNQVQFHAFIEARCRLQLARPPLSLADRFLFRVFPSSDASEYRKFLGRRSNSKQCRVIAPLKDRAEPPRPTPT